VSHLKVLNAGGTPHDDQFGHVSYMIVCISSAQIIAALKLPPDKLCFLVLLVRAVADKQNIASYALYVELNEVAEHHVEDALVAPRPCIG
jgi:hypothetical protein